MDTGGVRGDGRATRQIGVGERGHSNLVACGHQGHDLGGRNTHYIRGKRRIHSLYFGNATQRGDGRATRQIGVGERGHSNLVACGREGTTAAVATPTMSAASAELAVSISATLASVVTGGPRAKLVSESGATATWSSAGAEDTTAAVAAPTMSAASAEPASLLR